MTERERTRTDPRRRPLRSLQGARTVQRVSLRRIRTLLTAYCTYLLLRWRRNQKRAYVETIKFQFLGVVRPNASGYVRGCSWKTGVPFTCTPRRCHLFRAHKNFTRSELTKISLVPSSRVRNEDVSRERDLEDVQITHEVACSKDDVERDVTRKGVATGRHENSSVRISVQHRHRQHQDYRKPITRTFEYFHRHLYSERS